MKNLFYSLVVLFLIFSFISCEDKNLNIEDSNEITIQDEHYLMSRTLETDSKEKVRNSVLEMTELLQKMRPKYPLAFEELDFLLKSEFYIEPYLGLYELLQPNNSFIYKKIRVSENIKGSFKRAFEKELNENKQKYPNLVEVSTRNIIGGISLRPNNLNKDFDLDFYDTAAIAFYAPYIEDLNDIEFDINGKLTIVPGVVDADTGIAYREISQDTWATTNVDDDYAENNYTFIIQPIDYNNPCGDIISAPINAEFTTGLECYASGGGVGGSSGTVDFSNQYSGNCDKLEPNSNDKYIRQIFIGHAKINNKKQYDRLISFTNNGGGSEIRIGRLDSRDQITIDSIGNISANQWDNIVSIDFSRKDIRKKRRKWVGSIWHQNWECNVGVHEVLLGIYEEDTEGDIVFDQTINWQDEELFSIDATIQNRSKDEIIRKIVREEDEFFATNLLDQGCGDWDGENSFDDRDWAIYDCGSNFIYTMPHRWVPLN